MDKKGSKRWRFKFNQQAGMVLAVLVLVALNLIVAQERPSQPISYGKFVAILSAPGLEWQAVQVSATDIRADVRVHDRISGIDPASLPKPAAGAPEPDPTEYVRTVPLRAPRKGVELDPALFPALREHVPFFQAGEDESPMAKLVGY